MDQENLFESSETLMKQIEFLTVMNWRKAEYKGK